MNRTGTKAGFLDDADFDVDEDGGYLYIYGDFVEIFEDYLESDNITGVALKVDVTTAEKLVKEISRYLP